MPHLLQCVVEACWFLERAVGFQSLCALWIVKKARNVELALIYEDNILLIKPLYALAVLPEAILTRALILLFAVDA